VLSLKNENLLSEINNVAHKVFGFAGWSGAGKTTLIEKVIVQLTAKGLRVSLVKHAHHSFDVDQSGKDSHRHRVAGASEVLVSSSTRYALMHELRGAPELTLEQSVARLSECDLVLIEGFKHAPIPKLEIWRAALGKPTLFPSDANITAIATDDALSEASNPSCVRFGLDDIDGIAAFVLANAKSLSFRAT
jgi:molybdopterin-guanine dinucleotide biosynthesis adapter protein